MKTTAFLTLFILLTSVLFGQEINFGFKDSVYSSVLNESRKVIINLPAGYNETDKSYPVLYRLDGDLAMYSETIGIVNRLTYIDELIPEMIVVMIENTNRNRDMMPTKTGYFNSEPGAENFKNFIEQELIPYINNSYRTTNERHLCGQSLSAIFTMYYFLTGTNSFDSFIACSGAFLDFEEYFNKLTDDFLQTKQKKSTTLFLTHGLKDFLDPEGNNKIQLLDFSKKTASKENVKSTLKIYEEEGHVPFQSLYHALKFIYAADN